MGSPSTSETSSPIWLALIKISSNSWMIRRLCSIAVWLTNREKPLISGMKSSPLFSTVVSPRCAVSHNPDRRLGTGRGTSCLSIRADHGGYDGAEDRTTVPQEEPGSGKDGTSSGKP